MTPERWKRTEELYHAARARAPGERAAFLAEACSDDESLRRDVESLLNEQSDDGFLAGPVLATPTQMVSAMAPGAMAGRSLGGYEMQMLLGQGGMGEVYRAHDTKLGRDVAVKVLPRAFTSNPDRLARFEREARMLAALNHPNICGIYGLEDADGIRLLVLELVEGETLADRLAHASSPGAKGEGLPLRDALGLARQIADALEVAHEKGIVHRDLKPANIKITPDGAVKVLDFGLAKAVGGDGSPPDLTRAPETTDGEPRRGAVVGTAAYMSPEQARGLPVDKRTDIWAFGCVLYEMLTGRRAFPGDTASDSIAKILEREPDWSVLPPSTPASIRRLLLRCLAKDSKRRLRDIGDVRIEIDSTDEPMLPESGLLTPVARAKPRAVWLPWVALAVLALAAGTWEVRRSATTATTPPLSAVLEEFRNAQIRRVTNWTGTEEQAEISPDGNWVAFLADREGQQFDVWVSQLGTGAFTNLTNNRANKIAPWPTSANILRSLGFSGDGSEIWFNPVGNPGREKVLIPLQGGDRRKLLDGGYSAPSWSTDNSRLVYFASSAEGDPLFLASGTGANARPIVVPGQGKEPFFRKGMHTHNPAWSSDDQWIYVMHGTGPTGAMDVWRVKPSGGESPTQLTNQNAPLSYLTPLDARTLLYVARAEDWSGPWLWALDVESKDTRPRRVTVGLEQFISVSASRDGRGRVIATVANPTASLWRVPVDLDRRVEEGDVRRYRVPTERALAPRFTETSLFYLSQSARVNGDGLFRRTQDDQSVEVWREDVLSDPPAVSRDGSLVAVVVRRQTKRQLVIMSADGTNPRTLTTSIDIRGMVGQGAADWSPDNNWIVTGGISDMHGPGLFKIPVSGGEPVQLVPGEAYNPVWSPKDDLIVYAVPSIGGVDELHGVRQDGTPVALPKVEVRLGGAHRFLRNGILVYLERPENKDFWWVDLGTGEHKPLTNLNDLGYLNTFDVTPDGKYLVFDRTLRNSDVVLIDLKRPGK